MEIEIWQYWLILTLVLFIVEVFVPGFILGCLAIGALGGMIASGFTSSFAIQLIAASVTSALAFAFIRPFALKRLFNEKELKTNIDSLIGRRARVSQAFDPAMRKGRVAVDGDDWMAYVLEDAELSVGDIVEVLRVESNALIVKPITN